MRGYLSQWTVVLALLVVLGGCDADRGPTSQTTTEVPNVYFQPNLLDPIQLTDREAATVRQIVAKFAQAAGAEQRDAIAGYKIGDFVLGDVHYAWQGKAVYRKATSGMSWDVVVDERLAHLSDTYMKALGQPPYKQLSPEDWRQVLTALDPSERK